MATTVITGVITQDHLQQFEALFYIPGGGTHQKLVGDPPEPEPFKVRTLHIEQAPGALTGLIPAEKLALPLGLVFLEASPEVPLVGRNVTITIEVEDE